MSRCLVIVVDEVASLSAALSDPWCPAFALKSDNFFEFIWISFLFSSIWLFKVAKDDSTVAALDSI